MTSENEFVFVLMPFREGFDEVYQDAIRPAVESCGLDCSRADELFSTGVIIEEIENSIRDAVLLIADLTTRNPNVFYEVGVARALDKEVVLLTQAKEDVPFDLQHRRYLPYGTTGRGLQTLRESLTKTIRATLPRARRTESARLAQQSAGSDLALLREEVQALRASMQPPIDGEIGDNPQPVFHTARLNALKASCQSNLKQLGLGMRMYAQDEDERFPDRARWDEAILPYVRNAALLRCPAAPDLAYAYAMNSALSGFPIALMEDPSRTPLLFDSSIGTPHAWSGKEGLCNPPRHLGRNNVVFADGHVASVKPDDVEQLLWEPRRA
jgi:prepilin-type processing-associated H-X9-DG protein